MSRSGYSSSCEGFDLGRWRQAVKKALRGRRGQSMLREMLAELDSMPDKKLCATRFTADGQYCALGAVAARRGIDVSDLGEGDDVDAREVGHRFGIAFSMAAEIMYMNDEYLVDMYRWVNVEFCGPPRPGWPDFGKHTREVLVPNENHATERWKAMRAWIASQIR